MHSSARAMWVEATSEAPATAAMMKSFADVVIAGTVDQGRIASRLPSQFARFGARTGDRAQQLAIPARRACGAPGQRDRSPHHRERRARLRAGLGALRVLDGRAGRAVV